MHEQSTGYIENLETKEEGDGSKMGAMGKMSLRHGTTKESTAAAVIQTPYCGYGPHCAESETMWGTSTSFPCTTMAINPNEDTEL